MCRYLYVPGLNGLPLNLVDVTLGLHLHVLYIPGIWPKLFFLSGSVIFKKLHAIMNTQQILS